MPVKTNAAPELPRATAWLSRGLEALVNDLPRIADPQRTPVKGEYDFDVVIVGSGYGGSVAAAELSSCKDAQGQPLKICVLERGKEYLAGMFPSRLADLAGHIRFTTPAAERQRGVLDGLYDMRWSDDAAALVACGLGGGSLINAGVMEMPLPQIFHEARWPTKIRRDTRLAETAERLRAWLGARPMVATNQPFLAKTEAFGSLAGGKARPAHITVASDCHPNSAGVAMSECRRCGDCGTGCNYNAKESLDLNLLRLAQQSGVRIVTGATVLRVSPADERWQLDVNHTDAHLRDSQRKPFALLAKRVILAAGTFGSTEILIRSQVEGTRFSDQLGRKFSANGDMLVIAHDLAARVNAVADETQDPVPNNPGEPGGRAIGPTITAMLDLREGNADTDLVIQDLAVPGPLRRLFEESTTTFDVLNRVADGDWTKHQPNPSRADDAAVNPAAITNSLVLAMIGRDDAEGELTPGGPIQDNADGMLTVRWPELRLDPRLENHHTRLGRLLRESGLGGRLVNNLLWRPLSDKLESVFGRQRGPLLTVHPLGGCAMGDDVRQGVTDHCGRVFDAAAAGIKRTHEGLIVLDGSVVPTSLGINPALTIAVLALRAITELKEEWQLSGGRLTSAPALQNSPGDARPVYSTPRTNPKPTRTSIELTEQVRGKVPLAIRGSGLKPHLVELTLTTKPVVLADLYTQQPPKGRCLPIANGRLRILREGKEFDPVADQAYESDIALEAEISGSLRLFDLEESRPLQRTLRAVLAWAVNRGIRDVAYGLVRRGQEWLRLLPPGGGPSHAKLLDILHLCSRAGGVRLIEYDLYIDKVVEPDELDKAVKVDEGARFDSSLFAQKKIRAVKRLKYARGASPWTQLLEMSVVAFPQMRKTIVGKKQPSLELNKRYLARQGVPLLRIVDQQDRVAALADLASFILYGFRVVLQIHALSFRRPDPPSTRGPQRLPGAVPGLPTPQIDWLTLDDQQSPQIRIRLARYNGSSAKAIENGVPKRPVLLIHGYSASGTTFAHAAVPGNLAQTLCDAGRDVWVLDMRSSSGLITATGSWPFEAMAEEDIPIAVQHVLAVTGQEKLDVVGHCMGAAMFSMAVLGEHDRRNLHNKIGRVVFSQVGPAMLLSPANVLAAYIMRYVRYFLQLEDYVFSPHGDIPIAGQLLDRALSAMRVPPEEYRRENPLWPPGKATPWVGTRHRMDALYARTFSLKNLSDLVLDNIDDFFGPLSVETVSQVIHFAGFNTVTDRAGINRYVLPDRVRDRLKFPMMSIHGAENGLVDPSTLRLMRNMLRGAGVPHLNSSLHAVEAVQSDEEIRHLIDKSRQLLALGQPSYLTWCIGGHGHQDCLIGKDASSICGVIAKYLGMPDILGPSLEDKP
ncbi:alpha/beta fold hydrolase [Mesorhizobium sp. LjNodule214]|uniref:alpha/beta fold hydrolase n=1 Tax=Mesorhizobium sp. LjNodule214 TaxID=3342252 RepID=UPI003ECFA4ED